MVSFSSRLDDTAPAFEKEGCRPFVYETKDGRRTVMSYWRVPDRLLDDPDALADWARRALAAAERTAAKGPGRGRKRRL
jgi:DNA transformation protein